MDGGKESWAFSKEAVYDNVNGALDVIDAEDPDIALFLTGIFWEILRRSSTLRVLKTTVHSRSIWICLRMILRLQCPLMRTIWRQAAGTRISRKKRAILLLQLTELSYLQMWKSSMQTLSMQASDILIIIR